VTQYTYYIHTDIRAKLYLKMREQAIALFTHYPVIDVKLKRGGGNNVRVRVRVRVRVTTSPLPPILCSIQQAVRAVSGRNFLLASTMLLALSR